MKSGILANPTTACALERCVLARKLFLAAARLSVHLQFAKLRRLHRPTHFGGPEQHRLIIVKTNVSTITFLR
jgi:hypothetical protein